MSSLLTLPLLLLGSSPPASATCPLEPLPPGISATTTWTSSISYSAEQWVPALDGNWDWLQMKSGEWLKGEVRELRQDVITFDSDEFDLMDLDWADVIELEMPRPMFFDFEIDGDRHGPGRVKDGWVIVTTSEGAVCRPRAELISIVPGGQREIDHWTFNTHVGLNSSVGNSEQASLSADFTAKRQDASTRLRLSYYGNVGTASGVENTNNHRGETQFDIFVTKHFYINAFRGSTLYDKFQNIRIRSRPSAGVGWTPIDIKAFSLDLELGAGYQYSRYISVGAGEDIDDHNVGFLLAGRFEWDITKDLDFDVSHETYLGFLNLDQSTFLTRGDVEYEWTDIFDLGFSVEHTRVREPVADDAGVVPKKDDVKIIFTLGLSFE